MILTKLKKIIHFVFCIIKFDFSVLEYFDILTNSKISSHAKLLGSFHIDNSVIDDFTYVALNAHISYTMIGKYCSIGPNFMCGWGIHPIHGVSTSPMFYSTKAQNGYTICDKDKIEERRLIKIGNDVFIGANVTVLDGVVIGDGAVIGAGSVVSKNIPPYAVAVGCPIKVVRYRFDEETIERFLNVKWWDYGFKYHNLLEQEFFNLQSFLDKIEKEEWKRLRENDR